MVFPETLIGAYGFNSPELLTILINVMVGATAPSAKVRVFPVTLMSPMVLGYPCAVLPDSIIMKVVPLNASMVLSAMMKPLHAF